jgi:hypothetical protein
VCRDGYWITYTTNPINCTECEDDYSNACEMR